MRTKKDLVEIGFVRNTKVFSKEKEFYKTLSRKKHGEFTPTIKKGKYLIDKRFLERVKIAAQEILPLPAIAQLSGVSQARFSDLMQENPSISEAIIEGETNRLIEETRRAENVRELHLKTQRENLEDENDKITDSSLRSEVIFFQRFLLLFEKWSLSASAERDKEVIGILSDSETTLKVIRQRAISLMNQTLNIESSNNQKWNKDRYRLLTGSEIERTKRSKRKKHKQAEHLNNKKKK